MSVQTPTTTVSLDLPTLDDFAEWMRLQEAASAHNGVSDPMLRRARVGLSLIARIRQLELALVEACDRWEGWDAGQGRGSHADRIAELRKLVKP